MRALNARLDSLSAEITSLSAHSRSAPPSAHPASAPGSRGVSAAGEGMPAERLLVLEAQVRSARGFVTTAGFAGFSSRAVRSMG